MKYRNTQQKMPLCPHELPSKPWEKVSCDFFELDSKQYLIIVDHFSKYIELVCLNTNTTAVNVIIHLKSIFARHGIPKIVFTDNGPQFSSTLFKNFAQSWEFQHNTLSPLYAQSNGMVERAVQTLKKILKKCRDDKKDMYLALLHYRNTPITEQIGSPAQLLMSRRLRGILPIRDNQLNPQIVDTRATKRKLKQRQQEQKYYYDRHTSKELPELKNQQKIMVQGANSEWQPGEVLSKVRHRSYKVKLNNGSVIERNRRYLAIIPENSEVDYSNTGDNTEGAGMSDTEIMEESDDSDSDVILIENQSSRGRVIKPVQRYNVLDYM